MYICERSFSCYQCLLEEIIIVSVRHFQSNFNVQLLESWPSNQIYMMSPNQVIIWLLTDHFHWVIISMINDTYVCIRYSSQEYKHICVYVWLLAHEYKLCMTGNIPVYRCNISGLTQFSSLILNYCDTGIHHYSPSYVTVLMLIIHSPAPCV